MSQAKKSLTYRYNEDTYIQEIKDYIDSTYSQHYVGKVGVQTYELLEATGRAEGFTLGSIIKYASRYGKKDGNSRKDLLKILHYGILMLWVHDRSQTP